MNDKEQIEAVRAKLALAQLHMRSSVNCKYPVVNVIGARSAIATATDLLTRLEVLSTPEPEPSHEQLQRLDHWLKAQNWADDIDRALSTLQAVNTIFGTSVAVAPVEVTRDELVQWFHDLLWDTQGGCVHGTLLTRDDGEPYPACEQYADRALRLFRVSRRDGEDKK